VVCKTPSVVYNAVARRKIKFSEEGGGGTEKGTNFHTGFLANQKLGNVIFFMWQAFYGGAGPLNIFWKELNFFFFVHCLANPMFEDELYQLSEPEMHFGRGWAVLVDFIAATHFQTNINNTSQQQAIALPPRILNSDDNPPFIRDFTKIQNNALTAINMIYKAETVTEGGFLYIWKKAMCSAKGRADGRDMLENLLEHPVIVLEDLICKLVIDFI